MAKNSKKNPEQGFTNPFVRELEGHFDGGDLTIMSNVTSVFDTGYVHKGENAMEKGLREQAPGYGDKVVKGRK